MKQTSLAALAKGAKRSLPRMALLFPMLPFLIGPPYLVTLHARHPFRYVTSEGQGWRTLAGYYTLVMSRSLLRPVSLFPHFDSVVHAQSCPSPQFCNGNVAQSQGDCTPWYNPFSGMCTAFICVPLLADYSYTTCNPTTQGFPCSGCPDAWIPDCTPIPW